MLTLSVYSPERKLLEREKVEEVTLTGSEGQIQVLPGHAAMIGNLMTGGFSFTPVGKTQQTGVISTGFFEIQNDQISIMAETIELKDEIDLSRAKRAQQKSEGVLTQAAIGEHEFQKYQLKLQRALIRQQIAGHS
jgi:F-type H+-transporting ATPase subunit epsilon